MSDYLIREIENAPNVDVRYATEVAGCGGTGALSVFCSATVILAKRSWCRPPGFSS